MSLTIPGAAGQFLRVAFINSTQRDALSAESGMVISNSTTQALETYVDGSWRRLNQPYYASGVLSSTIAGSNTDLDLTISLDKNGYSRALIWAQGPNQSSAASGTQGRQGVLISPKAGSASGEAASIMGRGAYGGTFNTQQTPVLLSDLIYDTGFNVRIRDCYMGSDGDEIIITIRNIGGGTATYSITYTLLAW